MKVTLAVKRPYGDLTLESSNFEELVESLKSLPEWLNVIDGLILRSEAPTKKDLLRGLVEDTSEGTVITLPKEKASDKEAICLLLYVNEPNSLQPREVAKLLTISGRLSAGFGARNVEENLPATPDKLYGIGSVTKSFVARALIRTRILG